MHDQTIVSKKSLLLFTCVGIFIAIFSTVYRYYVLPTPSVIVCADQFGLNILYMDRRRNIIILEYSRAKELKECIGRYSFYFNRDIYIHSSIQNKSIIASTLSDFYYTHPIETTSYFDRVTVDHSRVIFNTQNVKYIISRTQKIPSFSLSEIANISNITLIRSARFDSEKIIQNDTTDKIIKDKSMSQGDYVVAL